MLFSQKASHFEPTDPSNEQNLPPAGNKRILPPQQPEPPMTLCPIAIAVGCKKCPAFSVCPLKEVIGDQAPKAADDKKPADDKK